jgi:cyclase
MKRKMFLGADVPVFKNAQAPRERQTNAEILMWAHLRENALGHKFRRQHHINIYIADFYCHGLKLIIEIDGGIQADPEVQKSDIERQKYLESEGISFLRFTNDEIEKNIEATIKKIEDYIKANPPK